MVSVELDPKPYSDSGHVKPLQGPGALGEAIAVAAMWCLLFVYCRCSVGVL